MPRRETRQLRPDELPAAFKDIPPASELGDIPAHIRDLARNGAIGIYHHGSQTDKFWRAGKMSTIRRPFEGVIPNLERLYAESESEFTRNRLKAFMAAQFCNACNGRRLKPEILAMTLGGDSSDHKSQIGNRKSEIPKPHAILFDAFSPARNPAMWTLPLFQDLLSLLDPRRPAGQW
jgi:hypothetical protein